MWLSDWAKCGVMISLPLFPTRASSSNSKLTSRYMFCRIRPSYSRFFAFQSAALLTLYLSPSLREMLFSSGFHMCMRDLPYAAPPGLPTFSPTEKNFHRRLFLVVKLFLLAATIAHSFACSLSRPSRALPVPLTPCQMSLSGSTRSSIKQVPVSIGHIIMAMDEIPTDFFEAQVLCTAPVRTHMSSLASSTVTTLDGYYRRPNIT